MDFTVSSTSSASPLLDAARSVANASRPQTSGFMTTLESTLADPASAAAEAEALVGTRIEAPPGGCGCDALVATATDAGTARANTSVLGSAPADAVDIVLTRGSTTDSVLADVSFEPIADRTEVQRGDLLELLGEDRNHLAIARGLGEMISVNPIGIVEITEIPWALVEGRASSPR